MPKAMEKKLKKIAKKRGYSKKRTNAFVYGTMRKTGWKPSTQKMSADEMREKAMKMLSKKKK